MNYAVDVVLLRGVTIVTLEAMKSEALEVIRADITTGKPVDLVGKVAKKEVTLQDLFLQRKYEGMLLIGRAEALTSSGQTHLVVKERSSGSSATILKIWQRSVQTLLCCK